jgi:hypothetical protein
VGEETKESQRQWRGLRLSRPLVGTPRWVELDIFLNVVGTDKGRVVALPRGRRRLVLVEQWGLGWVAGTKESQRAVARFYVNRPPCRHPELGRTRFLLAGARHELRQSRSAAVRPTPTRFGGAMGSGVGGGQERESQRALATFEVKSPLVGTPSWVEPD